jgi:lipoyl(octanoyl) transferase
MTAETRAWRFVNTGLNSGAFNMEYDERLARDVQCGAQPPTLRVYGWQPKAVSLGHHQAITDINEDVCRARGIDIVRRATGGRAILHAAEVTYSVAMFSDERSILDIYSSISEALACGLRMLGASVEFATTQPEFSVLYKQAAAIPCFASSARHEIQFEGKKLVGSAQRRYASASLPEVVLQHGSILVGGEHEQLIDLLAITDTQRTAMRKGIEDKTTTLESILGRSVGLDEAAEVLRSGFERTWNIHFTLS